MLTAVVAAAAGFAVLVASKQALVDRSADERHFYVQVAVFVVAGLGWALAHPGPQRALRAGLGAVAGAIAGVAGTFALGSTDQHIEALGDEVFSGSSAGRALLWAAVTAAAWGVTVVAGTPRARKARSATGAAFGGAATGAAMGLLAGTTQFGTDIFTTDLWFSLPFADAGDAVKALPLLLVACVVPLVLATTAGRAASFAPILNTGIAAALLLPALGGLAGYQTDLDEARRDGALVTSPDELDLDEDDGGGTSSGSDRGDVGDVDVATTVEGSASDETDAAREGSAADDEPATSVDSAGPATTAPRPTSPPTTTPPPPTTRATRPPPTTTRPTRPPVTTPHTVPATVDPGYPVVVSAEINGSNQSIDQVRTEILFGPPTRPGRAPVLQGGKVSCAPQGSAVIPFYVTSTPTTANGPHKVSLRWSQSLSGREDTGRFPMTIEFHDFNGTRCTSATNPDLVQTGAVYEWARLVRGEEGAGNGDIIVENYWDANGKPVGRPSALLSVIPVVNDEFTTNTFIITGSDIIRYEDPQTGDTYGVMRIAR